MALNNTMTIEDVLNTVDNRYRLSLYLKLRGHIAYKAAKLAGQYVMKTAKIYAAAQNEQGEMDIMSFNEAAGYMAGQYGEDEILEGAGMEVPKDMRLTLQGLVEYANKLNFDMQEMVDPTGTAHLERGFAVRGVYFDEAGQRASWVNSVQLLAEPTRDVLNETYESYCASIDDKKFCLTEAEWTATQAEGDNFWKTNGDIVVDVLMNVGTDEREFGDMDVRSQIGAIENMRGKIGACIDSCLKSVKYNRDIAATDRVAEASKIKGLIHGFNELFCDMLESSRYANHHEYMYNYMPQSQQMSKPVTRRIVARQQTDERRAAVARVSDKVAESINEGIEAMESDL